MVRKRQQGAVLIVGLIILLMLGMIGTGSLDNVVNQQRIVSNVHDDNRAFQGAEAALAWCEKLLDEMVLAYDENVMAAQIHADDRDDEATADLAWDWWNTDGFWRSNGVPVESIIFSGENRVAALAVEPRCYRQRVRQRSDAVQGVAFYRRFADVEDVMADQNGDAQTAGGIYHFRVTAQSGGAGMYSDGRSRTEVVLQSDYFKRLF